MQAGNARPSRGRILAVDDSAEMRLLVRASLESFGYSVTDADNGQAAIDAARLERFDAVILDVDMPGLDGLAVGRALRDDPRTCSSVIAMHTSLDEVVVRNSFDQYDVFLQKPCTPRELGECVDRLVQGAGVAPGL